MIVGKAIYNILTNDANVAAIVSTRVYPAIIEQSQTDQAAVVYRVDDTEGSHTKSGASTLDTLRVYVWAFAETYDACHDLSEKVRAALEYKFGTYAGVVVDGIHFERGDEDDYDPDLRKYYISKIYKIRVKR